MPRYLSPEWFRAAGATPAGPTGPPPAAVAGPTESGEGTDPAIVMEQVVTGGPEGTVVYRVRAGGGRATIEWPVPEGADAADLRITADWDTATAVASGRLSAQRALMEGRLKLSGYPAAMAERTAGLVGADAVAADLRAATTF